MFRRFAFVLFPLFVLAAGSESDFNSLKNQIQLSLVSIDGYVSDINSELGDSFDQFSQLVYPGTSDYASGYNQALQDVSRSVMGDVRNAQQVCTALHTQISSTQQLVSQLQYGSASNIDYSVILAHMTNQLERIADLQDLTDDHVQTNTVVLSRNISLCKDVLDAILMAIADMGGSSGGSGGEDEDDTLYNIYSALVDCRFLLTSIDENVASLADFFTAQNGIFRSYLSLVEDRLKRPDTNLQPDLVRMWEYLLQNATNVVYNPSSYSLAQQTASVLNHLGENDIQLSNEGVIQLENLAVNQRQYLCSVEALKYLKGMTNNSDVAWITNYLGSVQSGYYLTFSKLFTNPTSISPFIPGLYLNVTNFIQSTSTARKHLNYSTLVRAHSNVFQRIEIALWALNGMFGNDRLSGSSETDYLLDAENLERRIDYTTNDLAEAVYRVGGVSNSLSTVVGKFKDLIGEFDLSSQNSSASPITLLPNYEMGGIQIDHIYFQADSTSLQDFSRIVFTAIYYVIFAVVLWFLFTYSFKVFVKCVAFVASTISKLLS